MTNDEKLMQQALEAMVASRLMDNNHFRCREVAAALRERLSQPKQEPLITVLLDEVRELKGIVAKLKAHPQPAQRKPWVGLTDEEITEGQRQSWVDKQAFESAAWWTEAKLREKNHG